MADLILRPKVKRAHVSGFVGVVVLPVKGNSDEASLKLIAAADLDFNHAFGKIRLFNPDEALLQPRRVA